MIDVELTASVKGTEWTLAVAP